jgi:hypothetical protein
VKFYFPSFKQTVLLRLLVDRVGLREVRWWALSESGFFNVVFGIYAALRTVRMNPVEAAKDE